MNPIVSILIATYNGEAYLRKQLDSIVNQTYKNLEIIIQDDGSKDNTLKILQDYATNDSRIRVSQNKSNLGIIQNFYDLISKCNGDYIAISDQDDIWEIDKIEILLNNISNYSLVYTDSELIKDDDSPWGTTLLKRLGHAPKSGRFLMELFTENSISGHACLFKGDLKNLIVNSKDIVCQTSYMYDQVIGAIASFKGGVAYYDRPLTRHRIHQSNNYNSLLHRETSILSSREDAKAARREARKKLPRSSFLKRKRKRFSLKIERAQEKIALTEMLLKIEGSPESEISSNAISKFDRCFFNRHLYTRLLQLCIKKETAKSLSRGRLYYLLFSIF